MNLNKEIVYFNKFNPHLIYDLKGLNSIEFHLLR